MEGSEIHLKSDYGQGSTFSFLLPLIEAHKSEIEVDIVQDKQMLSEPTNDPTPLLDAKTIISKEDLTCLLQRLQAASEMGDISQIKEIYTIISKTDALSNEQQAKMTRMMHDFDFDGIQNMIKQLLNTDIR